MAEQVSLVVAPLAEGVTIAANWSELDAAIATLVKDYEGLEIAEKDIAQAKRDMAYLNSLIASLESERKRVKNTVMLPVSAFEAEVKARVAPIAAARAGIEAQVKAFEERRKVEKRARLKAHWESYAGILADAVPFERIFDEKWLNASFSEGNAMKAITDIVEKAARDEAALTDLELEYALEAKAEFLATLDLGAAVERNRALIAQAEATRQFEAEKAAILAEQEAERQAAQDTPEPTPAPAPAPTPAPTPEPPAEAVEEPTFDWSVVIHGATRTQILALAAYGKSLGLEGTFKKVEA